MTPSYTIIASYGAGNRVIGADNKLPWKIPSDLKYFKQVTKKAVLVMGHNTWRSLKCKALPGRKHVVIASDASSVEIAEKDKANVIAVMTVEVALMRAEQWAIEIDQPIIYIIGGGKIYEKTLHLASGMILTEVANPKDEHGQYEFDGDVFFPEIGDDWISAEDTASKKAGEPEYTVRMYIRPDKLKQMLPFHELPSLSEFVIPAPEVDSGL